MQQPMLRYVVLRHEGIPAPHFDLMFETTPGSELASWRATEWPLKSGTQISHIAAHRRAYLEYEGPIAGDRGFVTRVFSGAHHVIEDHPSMLTVELEDKTVLRLVRSARTSAEVIRGS
jgi:hypothetical protein